MADPATHSGQSLEEGEETSSQMSDISGDPAAGRGERTPRRPREHTSMYQAALRGDWQAAEIILRQYPNVVGASLTKTGDTALHVAASTKRTNFVRQLVRNYLSQNDLCLRNNSGKTAFYYAAASGVVEIASMMRDRCPNLVNIRSDDNRAPIYIAASFGKTDMVSYLYCYVLDEDLQKDEWLDLLIATIRVDMYDVALRILGRNPELATLMDSNGGTALAQLVQKNIFYTNAIDEATERPVPDASYDVVGRVVVSMLDAVPWLLSLFGSGGIYEVLLNSKSAALLAKRLWTVMIRLEREELYKLLRIGGDSILHDAAEAGNVNFIAMLIRDDPDLILEKNDKGHTIFHKAVLHRQARVYSLIQQFGSLKDLAAMIVDADGNNILHLAAKSAPLNRMQVVSGPALQMQREFMWFEEVKKVVPISFLEMKNNNEQEPRQLFSDEHKDLLKDGEKWMKNTSNYGLIVGTLVVTLAFAAAITVPGGNDQGTGMPVLSKSRGFTIFLIFDATAMFLATTSVIVFFFILISRYQENDFLDTLPRKLMAGLSELFLSIISMAMAFTTTFFLLFDQENTRFLKWYALCIAVLLAGLPASVLSPILFDTILSVYSSTFLFRSGKRRLRSSIERI